MPSRISPLTVTIAATMAGCGTPGATDEPVDPSASASTHAGTLDGAEATGGGTDTAPPRTSGSTQDSAGPEESADSTTLDGTDPTDPSDPGPFEPHPTLVPLPDNTAINLGAFVCAGPDEHCTRVTDYSGMTYNSVDHQMLLFGGGHSTTMTDTVFVFDLVRSLSWSGAYEPTPCASMVPSNLDASLGAWMSGASGPYPRPLSAHTYDFVEFDPVAGELVLLGRLFTGGYCSGVGNDETGPIAHYDPHTQQWQFSADVTSTQIQEGMPGAEYDPIAEQFVTLGSGGLRRYDPSTRSVTAMVPELLAVNGGNADISALGYANHLTYFPPNDTFYFFARGAPVRTFALKIDRSDIAASTLEEIATTGPTSPHVEPGYDFDRTNEIIGGGVVNGRFYALDPQQAQWTEHVIQGDSPGAVAFHALVYDPIDNVFVLVTESAETFAYRYRSG